MKDRFVKRHTSECSKHNLPHEAQQRCSSRHRPETMLALCSVFTPLRCYQCNYLWPDGKCVHEVESLSLCVQFTNVQSIAGTFSTVCPSSTHTFRLLLEMKHFRSREAHLSLEYNNIKILGMSGAERDFITQLHTCKIFLWSLIFLGPDLQALLLTP